MSTAFVALASPTRSALDFVRDNTRPLAPPLVPEIMLHLAEESLPIWQKSEDELGQMNVPPPYWAFAWAGGQALARYLLDNRDLVRGRRVLDIGAGSGISGIAAKLAGASEVHLADIDAFAVAAAILNGELNGVRVRVTAEDRLDTDPFGFDVVLIGDLYYERALAERVTAFIDRAKALRAIVLLGDPQRSYFPRDRFTRLADYRVPVTRELEDSTIKNTAVWRA